MHRLFMNVKYKKQKFVRLKVITAAICVLLIFAEIAVTSNMIHRITHEYNKISVEELADIQHNDMIKFSVNKRDVVLYFKADLETGGQIHCALVRARDNRLILIEALDVTAPHAAARVDQMMDTPTLSFDFQGSAAGMTEHMLTPLNLNIVMHNTYREYGLTEDDLSYTYVKLSDPNGFDYVTYAFAGVGVGICLFIAVIALLWKSVNNIIYGIMVQKGYIAPELKVKKEDLIFENAGIYDSSGLDDMNSFYVDTEYNVRGEGETDLTLQRKQVDKVEIGIDGQLVRPVRKERSEDENIDFYQSGVTDEGHFYIDKNTVPPDDDDDKNRRLRY